VGKCKVVLKGDGFQVEESLSHPAGVVYSGGYDAELNTLFLASQMGHLGGCAEAGGDPSKTCVSGLRVFLHRSGNVYWADDSMSLPRRLEDADRNSIQRGLEELFGNQMIQNVSRLQDIPH
jgi:hypothetical protein